MADKDDDWLKEQLELVKSHHVEVTKPEGFADDEFAVRYTDDSGKEQNIIAKQREGSTDYNLWDHRDPDGGFTEPAHLEAGQFVSDLKNVIMAEAQARDHHVEVSKPDGLGENEFAVRYTNDNGQEQDAIATPKPGKDDEFDFWAPHKDPNTGKYTVKAEDSDIFTLGLNLYARNFYAKWYAEQKQAEAARQQGAPEQQPENLRQQFDDLKNEAETLRADNARMEDQIKQAQQAVQDPAVKNLNGQNLSVDERLDRIERNQRIMMDQLDRIEQNQRSHRSLLERLGDGLEKFGKKLEEWGEKLDRAGNEMLITSGRIQAGFDRLTGKENFAEYPSRPQPQQQNQQSSPDKDAVIADLNRRIAELEQEVKNLRELNTKLKEQLKQKSHPESEKEQEQTPEPEKPQPEQKPAPEPEKPQPEQKPAPEPEKPQPEQKPAPEPQPEVRNQDPQPEQKPAPEPQPEVRNQDPQQPQPEQKPAPEPQPEVRNQDPQQPQPEQKPAPKPRPSKTKKNQQAADLGDPDPKDPDKRYVLNPISGKKIPLADRTLKNLDPSVVSRINDGKCFRSEDLAVAITYARLKTNNKPLSEESFSKLVADAGFIVNHCISKDAVAIPCKVKAGKSDVDFYFSTKDIDFQKLQERLNPEAVQHLKTMLEGTKDINALTAERKSVKADMKAYLRQQGVEGKDATKRMESIYKLGAKSINTFFRSIEKNPYGQDKNNRLTIGKDGKLVSLDEARKAEQKRRAQEKKKDNGPVR